MERALSPPARTDLVELLLSSTGRMSRLPFLACAAGLAGLGAAFRHAQAHGADPALGWIVYPALLFPGACVLSKRLHDRGRAGWWGFVIVWALVTAWPTLAAAPPPAACLAWLILAGAMVYLGLAPGESAANRFGPAPGRSA